MPRGRRSGWLTAEGRNRAIARRGSGRGARDVGARRLQPLRDRAGLALGRDLVEACAIGAGQRVLDVAAGSGNVAIRAAEAGADVVASTSRSRTCRLASARRASEESSSSGSRVTPRRCPSATGSSTSSPRRPGRCSRPTSRRSPTSCSGSAGPAARIGMANFTPTALRPSSSACSAPYLPPPPPDAPSPLLWGDEAHVRELFGDRVSSLEASERELVETVPGPPVEYCEFYKQTFGPVIAAFASVEDDPERSAALDREFLDFATRANAGPPDGPTELRFEYLLVLARKRR